MAGSLVRAAWPSRLETAFLLLFCALLLAATAFLLCFCCTVLPVVTALLRFCSFCLARSPGFCRAKAEMDKSKIPVMIIIFFMAPILI
jgi:hypothetical protein